MHEIGKILESCVRLTVGDNWKITRSVEFKNRTLRLGTTGPADIYFTKSGIGWFADEPGAGYEGIAKGRSSGGKTFHPMTEFFHYSNRRWQRYQGLLQQLRAKQIPVKMVLGRAAKSWLQIADSLGLPINVPGYVRDASPFRGVSHVNGRSIRTVLANGFELRLINSAPVLLGTINGHLILQRAIRGRIQYLRHGITVGYLNDLAVTASRLKGVTFR